MTFEQLHSFYLIAKYGSFQKAADYLHTTQPTISARIRMLEQFLKTTLFDRDGYRAKLTSDGHRLLVHAEHLLRLKEQAIVEISGIEGTQSLIRFGASDSMAQTWLPNFIAHITSSYPAISFDLRVAPSQHLLDDLLEHKLDIAFLITPPPSSSLVIDPLCTFDMVLAAAPLMKLERTKIDYGDLQEFNIFTFDKHTIPYQNIRQQLIRAGFTLKLNGVSSLETCIRLAEEGLGIAALPEPTLNRSIKEGRLTVLDTTFQLEPLIFSTAYPNDPSAPSRRRLSEWASQRCDEIYGSKD
ncbi:LysR family transcriptional regulator [Pusillimonas sp. ANT_WB101]|uniref:LysR family transcriptional regulator n=1 Tax=Pusillimonas sp. ANT_WB101 TaxID=2597356 RepID=UPI0011EE374B|nr:LysR family transcriptional regulator [Pusillimonas sp. ANT_WB101]KAA0892560.1 LysR family transcriptional regulator [Pusillimonas sp. ANT_WB101]